MVDIEELEVGQKLITEVPYPDEEYPFRMAEGAVFKIIEDKPKNELVALKIGDEIVQRSPTKLWRSPESYIHYRIKRSNPRQNDQPKPPATSYERNLAKLLGGIIYRIVDRSIPEELLPEIVEELKKRGLVKKDVTSQEVISAVNYLR